MYVSIQFYLAIDDKFMAIDLPGAVKVALVCVLFYDF